MEASLSTSQIKETVDENMNVVEEITEDIPEEKQTEMKEVKKDKTQEPQKSVPPVAQNTVTVVAQIENDTKQKSNVEESEYETDTDESEVTVYNRPVEKPQTTAEEAKESDENAKKPSKTVTIDDEKNEEKSKSSVTNIAESASKVHDVTEGFKALLVIITQVLVTR